MTSVAAVVFLAASNSVGSPKNQTPDATRNSAEPVILAQDADPKEAKSSKTAPANVDSKGVILKGYDTVAYFKQGKALKGNPAIESTYQGVTYLFASAADKVEFENNPANYVPQYGGFCAYGVANKVLFAAEDPNAFTVYKGKLYLCGDEDALKSFKSNIDENIGKADTYWRQLTGS